MVVTSRNYSGTIAAAQCSPARFMREARVKRPSVAALAEAAVASAGKVVCVPLVAEALRRALPSCEHTDEELAHIVAVIAVSRGRNLSFVRPDIAA